MLPLLTHSFPTRRYSELDRYAGAHRRRQRDLFDIFALRARRLRLDDRIDESVEVLAELFLAERQLAEAGVDDADLFDAEFDLTALGSLHGFGDVRGHGAQLRVRHQALRTQRQIGRAH